MGYNEPGFLQDIRGLSSLQLALPDVKV